MSSCFFLLKCPSAGYLPGFLLHLLHLPESTHMPPAQRSLFQITPSYHCISPVLAIFFFVALIS